MVHSRWREEASFETLSRAGHSACAWEGKLLVFGGRMSATFFADVWAYDPATRSWEVWCERWPHASRSYHSTTLVGGEVWLCGGSDADTVVGDVVVFDPATRRWRTPALRGDTALLRRTAHGACLHPARPDCILLQGGYGGGTGGAATQAYNYLADLVEVNTRTGVVRGLRPAGAAPEPRAYHAFARLGACCCCVAGRSHGNKLVKGKQLVVVWDAAANRWLTPGVVGGELAPRSSHRAASVPGGILLFGGAVDRGVKAADLQLLAAGAHGRLSWRQCPPGGEQPGGGGGGGWPAGRGAHVVEVVGGRLYVLGGYGEERQYTGDCWSISLEVTGDGDAAPPASAPPFRDAAAKQSGGSQAGVPEASQWREARRSRPAAAFGSEPQAASAKRLRVAAAAAQQVQAAASAPAWEPGPVACGGAEDAVAAAPAAAMHQGVQPAAARQQQQLPQQQLPPAAGPALAPVLCAAEQRWAELQAVVQQQQVAAAAREQLVADLQRENAALVAQREGLERERQAADLSAAAVAQQHAAQVAELQRQLAAAQRERDEAARSAAAAGEAEAKLLELSSQLRRDRDSLEQDAREHVQQIGELNRKVADRQARLDKALERNAEKERQLDEVRESLAREQLALSELRRAGAEERQSFTRSLQDYKDQVGEARHRHETLQAQLDCERQACREAKEEMARQIAKVQEQADCAKRAEEALGEAQRQADDLRQDVQRLQAAQERWRRGKAAATRALATLQEGVEAMP